MMCCADEWFIQQHAAAISEKSKGICILEDDLHAVSSVSETFDYGLYPLLFEQPDRKEPELYSAVAAKIADGAMYPGGMVIDGIYPQKNEVKL